MQNFKRHRKDCERTLRDVALQWEMKVTLSDIVQVLLRYLRMQKSQCRTSLQFKLEYLRGVRIEMIDYDGK